MIGWWVITRTSSRLTHTHTHTGKACQNWPRVKMTLWCKHVHNHLLPRRRRPWIQIHILEINKSFLITLSPMMTMVTTAMTTKPWKGNKPQPSLLKNQDGGDCGQNLGGGGGGIHRWPVNSSHKRRVMRKKFPYDDVIIQSRGWRPRCWWNRIWLYHHMMLLLSYIYTLRQVLNKCLLGNDLIILCTLQN